MKICKEIDLSDYASFEDFVDDVIGRDAGDEMGVWSEGTHTSHLPCYFDHLVGTASVEEKLIPAVLEAACHFHQASDGLLMLSLSSDEDNHKAWLEAVQDYPGVSIKEFKRGSMHARTIWNILLPVTPEL